MAVTGNPPHSQHNDDHPTPTELADPPPHSETLATPSAQSSPQSGTITLPSPANRRGRPKKRSLKKQIWKTKKIQTLTEGLNPLPFMPKKINLDHHVDVLKRLGLYEFSKIELDRSIRTDLLVQLIANYDSKKRCSFVNEKKVYVNRVYLDRALKLPPVVEKEDKLDSGVFSDEAIGFIDDFIFNWLLLHEESWDMPAELVNLTRCVRDGHPEKLDSASLVWYKVEKELTQGDKLVDCYYASHLQCLIRSQQAQLLEEDDVEKVIQKEVIKDDETIVDVEECKGVEAVDLNDYEDIKVEDVKVEVEDGEEGAGEGEENVKAHEENEEKVSIVLEDDVEKIVKQEVRKDDETKVVWKNVLGEHILHRCHSSDINDYEDTKVEKVEVEDEEENGSVRFVEGFDGSFMGLSGPSLFDNGGKRVMEPEEDTHHVDGNSKRLKTDNMWDQEQNDFGSCMMQMQQWMEKGKMILASKEESYVTTKGYQDVAIRDLQQRNEVMEMTIKSKDKELEQKNYEAFRLNRELYLMGDLLQGYRKALNDTRFKFSEYRRRVPLQEESVYKDAGHGGLVLSTRELEKQRLKQEGDMMKLQTLASMENVPPDANELKEKVGVEEH